jgi:hypothetical protein
MATQVAFELNVNGGNAEKSILAIKTELKNANKEIKTAGEEFGVYSQQVLDAEQKVAVLKNQLSKAANESRKLTASDKLAAFNSTLNTVAGGFSAVIGAQALLGAESEDVQKQLARVQAAMSFAQGIESITAASSGFKKLAIVIKTNVVGAFSSMKAAIASTGIGLLVIGVGLLIEKFMSMGDAAEEAAKAQDKLNESTKRFADIGLKANLSALQRDEKIAVAKAKLAGKSEDEIFQIQQDYRKKNLEVQTGYYNEIKDADANAAAETLTTIKNGIAEGQAAELENQVRIKKIQQDAAKEKLDKIKQNSQKEREAIQQANEKAAEEIKSLEDEITLLRIKDEDERAKAKLKQDYDNKIKEIEQSKANEGLKNKELLALKQKFELDLSALENEIKDKKLKADLEKQNQIDKALTDARLAAITDENFKKQAQIDIDRQAEIDKQADAYNQGLIDLQTYNNAVAGINGEFDKQQADLVKQIQDKRTADEKAAAEERSKIAQAEKDLKIQLWNEIGGALGALGNLFEKGTAANKALGLAEIAIGTGTGFINALDIAQKSSKGTGPAAAFAFPIFYASQIAAVLGAASRAKSILQTVKGGGGNLNIPQVPKVAAPLTPQVQTTNLNQGQINQLASATSRAFVLESDVSGSQERIQRLNRAARIN